MEQKLWQIANVLFLDLKMRRTEIKRIGNGKHKYSLQTANALEDMKWGIRRECISATSEICWELKFSQPGSAVCTNTMMISKLLPSLSMLLYFIRECHLHTELSTQRRCMERICYQFVPWEVKRGQLNPPYQWNLAYSPNLQDTCQLIVNTSKVDKPAFCKLETWRKYIFKKYLKHFKNYFLERSASD